MSTTIGAAVEKASPVAAELDKQSNLLKQLEELAAKLCNRLEFISRESQPAALTEQQDKTAICSFGRQLDTYNDRLKRIVEQLQDMCDRLEI